MDNPSHGFLSGHQELIEKNRRLREEAERLCNKVKQQIEHLEWLVDSIRRERLPGYFQPLQNAIRAMHGCESRHRASFAVRKVRDGRNLWDGIVEEFELIGTSGDNVCYAWQYREAGQRRTFSVLGHPPVASPQAAVQFFLLARDAPVQAKMLK